MKLKLFKKDLYLDQTLIVTLSGRSYSHKHMPISLLILRPESHKQIIGQFPDWKIEAARSLVDKIKQGIRLGTDPKSTFEANKAIPTFEAAIAQWKT